MAVGEGRTIFDVVVVGGGIGGLSVANGLARHGYDVCVLERASQFGEVGAGLQLAPNATRLLDGWGLLDAVVDRGVLPENLVLRDAVDGRVLTSLSLGADFRRRYGGPYVVVHRSDLHAVLLEACQRAGVTLLTDSEVVDVELGPDQARTVCANGATFTSDVVLGLDGLESRLRNGIVGDSPVQSGFVAYRGTVSVDHAPESIDLRNVVAWLGPDCHLVQYPLRRSEMVNQVAVFRTHGGSADATALEAAFSECCEPVRSALGSMWSDRYWPMLDRLPAQAWSRGRLGLLGDAAHPMLQYLAQGACQAMEDAQILADQAVKHRTAAAGQSPATDWPAAIAATERERVPRTARIQRTARIWGEIWHLDGVARLVRNELMRNRELSDYSHIDWLYGV